MFEENVAVPVQVDVPEIVVGAVRTILDVADNWRLFEELMAIDPNWSGFIACA
jgi:hypothetical protein